MTAHLLQDPEERDAARGMFDFWMTTLAASGERPADLAGEWPPFADGWAAEAAAVAQRTIAGVGEAVQAALGQVLARLLETHAASGMLVEAAPVAETDLLSNVPDANREKVRRLLHALIDWGVVRRRPSRSGEVLAFSFRSIARAWPWLMERCGERQAEQLVRDRLLATAELWEDQKGDTGLLLSGAPLQRAAEVLGLGDDTSIGSRFVRASRQRRERMRNWTVALLLVVIVALVGTTVYFDKLRRAAQDERNNALAEKEQFQALAQTLKETELLAAAATPDQGKVILQGVARLADQTAGSTRTAQIPLEQLEIRILICDGAPAPNRANAIALQRARVAGASGRWRRDYLSQSANASPAYRLTRNEIRYNPEEEAAADWLTAIIRASSGVDVTKVLTFFPTPGSVSVFFCNGANLQASTVRATAAANAGLVASEDTQPSAAGSSWYAVVSSLPFGQTASVPRLVAALDARFQKAGIADGVHVYCTRISRSIALTSGRAMSEGAAKERARRLRRLGLVADAFAQPDRNWTGIADGAIPDCGGGAVAPP